MTLSVAEAGGFSVLWGCLRNLSPKGLPGPFYVLRRVVVSVQACATVWARFAAGDGTAVSAARGSATAGRATIKLSDTKTANNLYNFRDMVLLQ